MIMHDPQGKSLVCDYPEEMGEHLDDQAHMLALEDQASDSSKHHTVDLSSNRTRFRRS